MYFQIDDWRPIEKAPQGDYAMWWSSPDDPLFANSAARNSIYQIYEALDGFETYAFAYFLKRFGLGDESAIRMVLPEQSFILPLQNSEEMVIVFSVSEEKGMRFHFNPKTISATDRNDFWETFALFARIWKQTISSRGFPQDTHLETKTVDWWRLCDQAAIASEQATGGLKTIGKIIF